ncbi:MAG: hypothetical protein KC964_21920 [Candidatus Omnitrophica bacterium]|nr:hypothetical protein [Candidatus Omnitrophota bacterium]
MVIERSRKWVKERIPAFICKETNWWVSRWIQANIFLCPHCRKEYRSLKSVWSFLDSWESDTPSGDLEENFSCKFREQFPSAFKTAEDEGKSRLIPSGFGLVGVASGALAVGLVCVIAVESDYFHRDIGGEPQGIVAVVNPVTPQDQMPETPLNEAPRIQPAREVSRVATVTPLEIVPPSERPQLGNYEVKTVSLSNDPFHRPEPRFATLDRHTTQINNHPVANFSALSQAVDDGAY